MKTRRLVLPLAQMMPPPKVRRAHTHTHQQRPGMWHGPTGPRSRVHGPKRGSRVPSGRTARGRAARLTLGATCDSGIMLSDATVCSVASCSARFCPAFAVICRAFKSLPNTEYGPFAAACVCACVCAQKLGPDGKLVRRDLLPSPARAALLQLRGLSSTSAVPTPTLVFALDGHPFPLWIKRIFLRCGTKCERKGDLLD